MDDIIGTFTGAIWHALYTLAVFSGFLTLVPWMALCCFSVQMYRFWLLTLLSWRFPYLELVTRLTARATMDTHRCQGVVTVVLQIKGQCNIKLIQKKILNDVVEKRRKDGELRFPHMKNCLTSRYGHYAWVKDTSDFKIENNVFQLINPPLRNRLTTSENIQEYISDCVTKYIPPWNNSPPWQVMVITTEPDRFYLVARVHHLYISEDGISFGHLLMVNPEESRWTPKKPQDIDSIEKVLVQIFRQPQAWPMLCGKIRRKISSIWDPISFSYNPLQNPSFEKSSPNIFDFHIVCCVAVLSIIRKYLRTSHNFFYVVKNEIRRRGISFFLFIKCCLNTMYPFVIIRFTIAWCWWIFVKVIFQFPMTVLHVLYDSPYYLKWFVVSFQAIGESLYIFYLFYTAPRVLLDELFWPIFNQPSYHHKRTSLSGRKVVCWSDPIPIEVIRQIREKTGVASCEIQLSGVAAAMSEFFRANELNDGDTMWTTTRFIPQEHLLQPANRISSGLLCLGLPMDMPEDDTLYGLHLMQLSLQDAMTNQTALYLASTWQYDYGLLTYIFPTVIARIVLYVLSSRYSIMLTQVEAHTKEMQKRRLIWGQEIESFIYWRPPQANVCVSVTLINYGDEMRFAVMSDALLAPKFTSIVSKYESFIRQLAEEADNYSESNPSRIRSPVPDPEEI